MMSFLAKFWSNNVAQKKNQRRDDNDQFISPAVEAVDVGVNDEIFGGDKHLELNYKKYLQFGADPVRILLFRDCDSRVARKLLFDSMSTEYSCEQCNNIENSNPNVHRNGGSKKLSDRIGDKFVASVVCEHEKQLNDDTSVLCAMTFGSVSMTYKGPSFKIHVVKTPPSIVCAKVFPSSEHSVCRPSQLHSSETLGTSSVNFDSSSSNSSLRTQSSRPGSGNLSSSSLSPALRKNSTCSSVGSGWDIDVPRLSSSQSLDGSGTSSVFHSSGSLSSLRRRWQRAVTTSLVRSESDELFNEFNEFSSNSEPLVANSTTKHRTRLALVLLLHLPAGRERETTALFLEHAPLLEGMLDRLRYSCNKGPRHNLVNRLYRATNSSTLRLLRRIMRNVIETNDNVAGTLIWHNVLLNSTTERGDTITVGQVNRSLQRMCWLLEMYDTKSTNFFISTIVTAVLTHHLGWVHTAPPCRDKQVVEKIGKQYSCNPLWAQLSDLYGALGTPTRTAHTVIAGEPDKAGLIESVLHFLSYFVRSGVVDKQQQQDTEDESGRCRDRENDFREARAALERALRRNPSLKQKRKSTPETGKRGPARSSASLLRRTKHLAMGVDNTYRLEDHDTCHQERIDDERHHADEATIKKLKRSGTIHSRLGEFAEKSCSEPSRAENEEEDAVADERQAGSKVKIIVSNSDEDERSAKLFGINKQLLQQQQQINDNNNVTGIEQQQLAERPPLLLGLSSSDKLPFVDRNKLMALASGHPANNKTLDEQLVFAARLNEDATRYPDDEIKTHVLFTLGDEKPTTTTTKRPTIHERLKSPHRCQCSYTFTCVPSTSAELPEVILRKIIQRNFPESSKSMQAASATNNGDDFCMRCRRGGYGDGTNARVFDNGKLLETPTNATEVLRGCSGTSGGSAASSVQPEVALNSRNNDDTDSLEALLEANGIVEIPMPRTNKSSSDTTKKRTRDSIGFPKSLIGLRIENATAEALESGYTYGMVMQGLTKKMKKSSPFAYGNQQETKVNENEWWWPIRENLGFSAKFPVIDQPIAEALCIIGDLDNWQVGILSNTSAAKMSVGMSRLVSNMLEAFVCMWKTFHSPEICIKFLESRLREMWLRSRTLAEFLLTAEPDAASVDSLTDFLDVDVADLPLLVAVASTHTPQISQRFGITLT